MSTMRADALTPTGEMLQCPSATPPTFALCPGLRSDAAGQALARRVGDIVQAMDGRRASAMKRSGGAAERLTDRGFVAWISKASSKPKTFLR
jgi:hypothetical protein